MKRLNRPNPKRLRLALSASLVVTSVLGVWWIIESNKVTESFVITKKNLATGSPLVLDQLTTRELSLFEVGDGYLREMPEPGSYLLRPVSEGELIPLSALTNQALDDWASLVITPSVKPSSEITTGSLVSLWAASKLDYGSYAEPVLLALEAEVIRVMQPQGGFGADQLEVELRVGRESVPFLLNSIANGDAMALVASGQTLSDQ